MRFLPGIFDPKVSNKPGGLGHGIANWGANTFGGGEATTLSIGTDKPETYGFASSPSPAPDESPLAPGPPPTDLPLAPYQRSSMPTYGRMRRNTLRRAQLDPTESLLRQLETQRENRLMQFMSRFY